MSKNCRALRTSLATIEGVTWSSESHHWIPSTIKSARPKANPTTEALAFIDYAVKQFNALRQRNQRTPVHQVTIAADSPADTVKCWTTCVE